MVLRYKYDILRRMDQSSRIGRGKESEDELFQGTIKIMDNAWYNRLGRVFFASCLWCRLASALSFVRNLLEALCYICSSK